MVLFRNVKKIAKSGVIPKNISKEAFAKSLTFYKSSHCLLWYRYFLCCVCNIKMWAKTVKFPRLHAVSHDNIPVVISTQISINFKIWPCHTARDPQKQVIVGAFISSSPRLWAGLFYALNVVCHQNRLSNSITTMLIPKCFPPAAPHHFVTVRTEFSN